MGFGKDKSDSGGFDPELKQALLSVFREGESLFKNREYQPYNSATVAPLSNIEMAGMQGVVNAAQQGYGQQQMRDAMGTTRNETMYNPGQVRAQGIGHRDVTAERIGHRDVGMFGPVQQIREERVNAPAYLNPQMVGIERLANTDYKPYENKFNTEVVDTTLADIERARKMQQNQNASRAVAAGAFGGDRQGIVESETNKAALEQVARTSAALRSEGFDKSTGMAQSDIANFIRAQELNQKTDLSAGQFSSGQRMQGSLANQQANMEAQNRNAANMLSTNQLNMQGQLANQRTNFEAQKQNQMVNMQGQLANQSTNFDAQKQNQMARLQAAMQNQNAGLQGSQQRLSAANQLGSMGQDYRNLMFQDPAAMMGIGQMQRDQAQRLMDDQYGRFNEERNYDLKMFDVLRGAAGILPSPLTNESKTRNTSFGIPV